MQPFTIAIADAEVADLRNRLQRARFPDEVEDAGWEYGTSLPFLRRFVAYWGNEFDWRAAEARLNRYPQFITEIDGETLHFVHVRGKGSDPVPLLLTNGWPSNFVELLPLVDRLTSEVDGTSFDVIIPQLPGYGFSSRPRRRGMNLTQIGHLFAGLMEQLGYSRFLVSGSDLGGGAVLGLVRHYPERLLGAHYCNVFSGYPRPAEPTAEEVEYFRAVDYSGFVEGAYAQLHGTKPTSLAVGLNDSPAGLAAWIIEKFHHWGDTGGDVESVFPFETLATLLAVYWFTETIGSSVRLYKEAFADRELLAPMPAHDVPQGVLVPAESDLPAPRAWGERNLRNLIHWNEARQGGHFPALEVPDVLAGDIRAFHREIRQRRGSVRAMDKTERLFAVMDALRRHRRPVTAAALAEEQGVSVRTLYRDVQTLIGLGAPIDGEAGVGYMLRPGFFLPPLMFTPEELEALVLGGRWVEAQPDAGLGGAARNALAKIATASPDDLRDRIKDTGLWPVLMRGPQEPTPVLGLVRAAMRNEMALHIGYADESGRPSERDIWPVQLAYYEGKQIVAGWCCMREAFRNFRTDRIVSAAQTEQRYGRRRLQLAREWRAEWSRLHPDWASPGE